MTTDHANVAVEESIIPSVSIEALLARRNAAVTRLAAIHQAMKEYLEIGEAIWPNDPDGPSYSSPPYKFREPLDQRASGRGAYLTDEKWLEQSTACVDAALWDYLLTKSGLRTFMDAASRKEWDEGISKAVTPPLNTENIFSTFHGLHSRRGELFERGVIGLFKSLSWHYKSNSPRLFGKRLIQHQASYLGSFSYTSSCDKLDDLVRAFCILDGKPEPDHRQGFSSRFSRRNGNEDLVDDYVRVRTFKNGNAHVHFLRPDLVNSLNRIIARHFPNTLPPAEH